MAAVPPPVPDSWLGGGAAASGDGAAAAAMPVCVICREAIDTEVTEGHEVLIYNISE